MGLSCSLWLVTVVQYSQTQFPVTWGYNPTQRPEGGIGSHEVGGTEGSWAATWMPGIETLSSGWMSSAFNKWFVSPTCNSWVGGLGRRNRADEKIKNMKTIAGTRRSCINWWHKPSKFLRKDSNIDYWQEEKQPRSAESEVWQRCQGEHRILQTKLPEDW